MRVARSVGLAAIAVAAVMATAQPAGATVTKHVSALGAGYKSTPLGGVSSASARFKAPSVSCANDTDFEVLYLGVTGLSSINERNDYAVLYAACNHSLTLDYFGVAYTTDGGFQPLSVAIGDTIVTKLVETGTTTTATVVNVSDNTSVSSTTTGDKDASVLIGDFGDPVIPTFDKVHFARPRVNGAQLDDPATPVSRERLKNGDNLQIATNALASGDIGFSIFFRSNA